MKETKKRRRKEERLNRMTSMTYTVKRAKDFHLFYILSGVLKSPQALTHE